MKARGLCPCGGDGLMFVRISSYLELNILFSSPISSLRRLSDLAIPVLNAIAADGIWIFSEDIRLDISCQSSA